MKGALVLLLCFVVHSTLADDTNLILTVAGVTYSNVTFRSRTPSTVTIFHSTGIATVPLAALPPDVQKPLGYDPDKARAYEAQQKAAREYAVKMSARLRQAGRVDARITQVLNNGLLAQLKHWQIYPSLIGNKTYQSLNYSIDASGNEYDWGDTVFLSAVPNLQKRRCW